MGNVIGMSIPCVIGNVNSGVNTFSLTVDKSNSDSYISLPPSNVPYELEKTIRSRLDENLFYF